MGRRRRQRPAGSGRRHQYGHNHRDTGALATEARAIFHAWYWQKLLCDTLPEALALMTYNAGVNCGVAWGAEFLQRSLNAQGKELIVDGIVGRRTLAAAA